MKIVVFLSWLCLQAVGANAETKSATPKSCIPTPSDVAATNLRKSGNVVTVLASSGCKEYMGKGQVAIGGPNTRHNPSSNTCDMGIPKDKKKASKEIRLFMPGVMPPDVVPCKRDKNAVAFFLSQEDDKNTFMIIDSANAGWFFTTELGGCDIFVAINPAFSTKPLVIHANANAVVSSKAANLHKKGEGADEIILANTGYNLVARVYSADPAADLVGYKATHPGVRICTYDSFQPITQLFYFIGYFDAKVGAWRFFLKGKSSGIVTDIASCP